MADSTVAFSLHADVAVAVRAALANDAVFAGAAEDFADDAATFFAAADGRWTAPELYVILIVPPAWAPAADAVPARAAERLRDGTLRLVIWDADAAPTWALPRTLVPKTLGEEGRRLLLNHVARRPAWGLATILPPRARVLSERIRSEAQIADKITQSLEFVTGSTPDFTERTMPMRLGLTALFAATLGTEAARRGDRPPAYQIGVAGSLAAVAVRWSSADSGPSAWAEPAAEWRMLFTRALASWIVSIPASGEVEVTLAFDVAGTENGLGPAPLVIDVLSTERQRRGLGLTEETEFAFEHFETRPEGEGTTFVTTKAAAPSLEAQGLRVEYHKIGLQFKELQEVSNDYLRRMAQAVESEKVARAEIQTLRVQLDYMKEKEGELTRKLQSAMDQYVTLKLEKKKKTG